MTKTKIRISPLKGYRMKLVLEISEISKEELTEVADSYLYEFKKIAKSGNELLFSIFFDKKYFHKNVLKTGNPNLLMFSSNKFLTLKITKELNEREINQIGLRYCIETEGTGEIPFTVKFSVGYLYFREKILEKGKSYLMKTDLFSRKKRIQIRTQCQSLKDTNKKKSEWRQKMTENLVILVLS